MARSIIYPLFISILVASIFAMPVAANGVIDIYPEHSGPFVDKIEYHIIEHEDQQVLALQDGDIDLIGEFIDPSFFDTLAVDTGVKVATTPRNGYGYFLINCDKYPLNITAFRRAFAFALDKERISDDVWDGLSQPLDSLVPRINPFSIEGQMPYSYHSANPDYGNQLLDEAGFIDIDGDGYREAPDGSDFEVEINGQGSNVGIETGQIAVEALQRLRIDVYSYIGGFWVYPPPYHYGGYDIYFHGRSFSDFDVDWLAYDYWSENAEDYLSNYPRWKNESYDFWREQLLHSIDYEEVYEAALEMQKIWIYECPAVICYENLHLSAYRADTFTGFINDTIKGIPCWWTNYRVHLKEGQTGPFGGNLRWSSSMDIDGFDILHTSSAYGWNVLQMLYDSPLRQGPDGYDIPWLLESYRIETHADNENIPDGHTRITFDVFQNITWTDGTSLTAEDIAFSLNYFREAFGIPYGIDLTDMTAAYAQTSQRMIAEFQTESYWHLHSIGYMPVIPKHVFEEVGTENWNSWSPDPRVEAMVTSGPFNVSQYVPSEYTELTNNPNYFRTPQLGHEDGNNGSNWFLFDIFGIPLQHIIVTIPSVAIIIIVGIKWKLDTKR